MNKDKPVDAKVSRYSLLIKIAKNMPDLKKHNVFCFKNSGNFV